MLLDNPTEILFLPQIPFSLLTLYSLFNSEIREFIYIHEKTTTTNQS